MNTEDSACTKCNALLAFANDDKLSSFCSNAACSDSAEARQRKKVTVAQSQRGQRRNIR